MLKTLSSQCWGTGSIPGQGTRSHMPQLRVHVSQLKILHATAKSRHKLKSKQTKKRISIKQAVKYNKLRKIAQEYFTWTKSSHRQRETFQNLSKDAERKRRWWAPGKGGREKTGRCAGSLERITRHTWAQTWTHLGAPTGEIHFWLLWFSLTTWDDISQLRVGVVS